MNEQRIDVYDEKGDVVSSTPIQGDSRDKRIAELEAALEALISTVDSYFTDPHYSGADVVDAMVEAKRTLKESK